MRTVVLTAFFWIAFGLNGIAQQPHGAGQIRCLNAVRTDWKPFWIFASGGSEVWAGGVGQILHSTDGGASWNKDSVGQPWHVYQRMVQDGKGRLLLLRGDGVLLRKDAGGWHELPGSIPAEFMAASGDRMIAAGDASIDGKQGTHFWTREGESPWQYQGWIPGSRDILHLAVDAGSGDAWAAGTQYHSYNFVLRFPREGGIQELKTPASANSRSDCPNGIAFQRDTVWVPYSQGIGVYRHDGNRLGVLSLDSLSELSLSHICWITQADSILYACYSTASSYQCIVSRFSGGKFAGEPQFEDEWLNTYSKACISPDGKTLYRLPFSRDGSFRQQAFGARDSMPELDAKLQPGPYVIGRSDRGWIGYRKGLMLMLDTALAVVETLCVIPSGTAADVFSCSSDGKVLAAVCGGGQMALLSQDGGVSWDTLAENRFYQILVTGIGEVCSIDTSGYHIQDRGGHLIATGLYSMDLGWHMTGRHNDQLLLLQQGNVHYLDGGRWISKTLKGVSLDTLDFLWADPIKGIFFFVNENGEWLCQTNNNGKTWSKTSTGGLRPAVTMAQQGKLLMMIGDQVWFTPRFRRKGSLSRLDGNMVSFPRNPVLRMEEDCRRFWLLDGLSLYLYAY